MWRKKNDFKPDRMGAGILNKLYITRRQRLSLLKWALYALFLVLLSLAQDVVLCRLSIRGATTDLVSTSILLLCVMLPTDTCAVFALISTIIYYFSGMAAGPYTIVFLTALGIFMNILRYSYLRKGFVSTLLCAGFGLMAYELLLFVTGLFLEYTTTGRFTAFCITGGISVAIMPLLYPVFLSIGKIGGESWKE